MNSNCKEFNAGAALAQIEALTERTQVSYEQVLDAFLAREQGYLVTLTCCEVLTNAKESEDENSHPSFVYLPLVRVDSLDTPQLVTRLQPYYNFFKLGGETRLEGALRYGKLLFDAYFNYYSYGGNLTLCIKQK